jgi:hypothetical protein
MPLAVHVLLWVLCEAGGLLHASIRGTGRARWAEGLVYSDPTAPPGWLHNSAFLGPAVPNAAPAPIPAAAMPPIDTSLTGAHYFEGVAPAPFKSDSSLDTQPVWPPSPPTAAPVALPMRPLTLLDAKGAEYASADLAA